MKLFFSGAEVHTYHHFLHDLGLDYFSMAFDKLYLRKTHSSFEFFADSVYWLDHGYSGKEVPDEGALPTLVEAYATMVAANPRIQGALEFDFLPEAARKGVYQDLYSVIPDRLFPVWDPINDSRERLLDIAGEVGRVAVVGSNLRSSDAASMSLLSTLRAKGLYIHIHQVRNPAKAARTNPQTASTTAWNAPLRFGELLVPHGSQVRRVSKPIDFKKQTNAVVDRLGYEREGQDSEFVGALEAGDMTAWAVVAVDTLLLFSELVTEKNLEEEPLSVKTAPTQVVHSAPQVRKTPVDNTGVLPIYDRHISQGSVLGENGLLHLTDLHHVGSLDVSQRMCDTCVLAAACPGYIPGNQCAYKIPVSLSTPEQLRSLMDTLLEIQTQRVFFMRFVEDVQGGETSKATGAEIDRLMNMLKTKNDLEARRESLSINVKTEKGGGILSALFGAKTPPSEEPRVIQQVIRPGN
jgi:hypothetical protein